jgi:hypothetical protein
VKSIGSVELHADFVKHINMGVLKCSKGFHTEP